MLPSAQIQLTEKQIIEHLTNGLRIQGAGYSVRCHGLSTPDQHGHCTASADIPQRSGGTLTVKVQHDEIAYAVAISLRNRDGTLIDPATLTFIYSEGKGYGNPASTDASVNLTSTPLAQRTQKNGSVTFMAPVLLTFSKDQMTEMLKAAARADGYDPLAISYTGRAKETNATITIKQQNSTGNIKLNYDQLLDALRARLVQQGYEVAPDGIEVKYHEGTDLHNAPVTSVEVRATRVPAGS
jgi:hypothetical protein